MACIDYGALLRVNGKFINKNTDLFMSSSDMGYVCKKAYDPKYKEEYDIAGNFFVYAGDEELLLTFYKGMLYVIQNGIITRKLWNSEFIAESMILNNGIKISVKHLEPELQIDEYEPMEIWSDYVKEFWVDATGNEKLSELQDGVKEYKRFYKRSKNRAREKGLKYRTQRWLAEWEHNGNKYEVIFGYGIDNDEETWNNIKNNGYGFTETEKSIIDTWFRED